MNTEKPAPSWTMLILVAVLTSFIGGGIGALGISLLRGMDADTESMGNFPPKAAPTPRKTSPKKPRPLQKVTTEAIVNEIVKIEEAFLTLHANQKETRRWAIQAIKVLKQQQAGYAALQKQFWGLLAGVIAFVLLGGIGGFFAIRTVTAHHSPQHAPPVQNAPSPDKALKDTISRLENNMAFFNETLSQAQNQSQRAVQTATNTAKALSKTIREIQDSLDDLHKESDAGDQRLLGIIKRLQRSLKTLSARTQESYLHIEDIEFEVVEEEKA